MKQKTLLLFQLLLAMFAFYSVLKYSGNLRLLAPLLCLAGMFLVGKLESLVTAADEQKQGQESETIKEDAGEALFNPLECLLKSKNVLLLTDAIHFLLKDLGLAVSSSPEKRDIDRLVRAPETQLTVGLKVLGNLGELNENWDKLDELADFDLGKGGKRRLLVIGSNSTQLEQDGKPKFDDFSTKAQSLLASKHIVAMTTLTIYKIYMLCKKNNVNPKVILELIQRHPGGVFRIEQYMKRSTKAA
ncbi:MAG: hypothetical protein JSU72_09815 [Deltaproteobacteria bacterium]|nr:MAG: hypothetical protein JSU72_09815 [Deltaproteobacteria bacterium]